MRFWVFSVCEQATGHTIWRKNRFGVVENIIFENISRNTCIRFCNLWFFTDLWYFSLIFLGVFGYFMSMNELQVTRFDPGNYYFENIILLLWNGTYMKNKRMFTVYIPLHKQDPPPWGVHKGVHDMYSNGPVSCTSYGYLNVTDWRICSPLWSVIQHSTVWLKIATYVSVEGVLHATDLFSCV